MGTARGRAAGGARGHTRSSNRQLQPPCLGAGQARPDGEDEVPLLSDRTPALGPLPTWAPASCLPVGLARSPPRQALPSLDPEKPLFLTAFYILNQKDFIRKEHTITYPRGSACLDTEGTRPTRGRMWPLDKPSLSSNVGATVEFDDLSWCHLGKQGTSKD